ncbi:MAG TPA: hypothetical protein VGK73_06925 [Polyangiaceae bacterium]
MGFFGRLLGIEAPRPNRAQNPFGPLPAGAQLTDQQALERYRYMLKTAPPETVESAHEEAFAKLTPDQRKLVLAELARSAPASESSAIAATPVDDTRALARTATRAELREPGVMERAMSGPGMGFGASLLSSFAMGFVGSMVANSFFSALDFGGDHGAAEADPGQEGDAAADDTQLAEYEDEGGGYDDGGDYEV